MDRCFVKCLGLFLIATLPGAALADGYMNDAETTRRLGGVGNYLFRSSNDERVLTNFFDFIALTQSSTETEDAEFETREVFFSPGSARLPAGAEATLDLIAEELKANRRLKVELSGFATEEDTNPDAAKRTGEELSSARAKAVMEALYRKGVPVSQIFWTGKGLSDSRRVEIRFQ